LYQCQSNDEGYVIGFLSCTASVASNANAARRTNSSLRLAQVSTLGPASGDVTKAFKQVWLHTSQAAKPLTQASITTPAKVRQAHQFSRAGVLLQQGECELQLFGIRHLNCYKSRSIQTISDEG
jgi:hypothetical protein